MYQETGTYISFFIYIIFMMLIGVYFYRKSKGTLSTYFLGNRNMNPWVTALSAEASDMSGWLFMSLPAVSYLFGYQGIWIVLGLLVGTILNWTIVAKRLRNFSEVFGNSITVPEYIQNRFHTQLPVLGVICAVIVLFFFTLYIASGFSGEAKLFEELFGLEYHTGLFLGAGVILFYTFIGGFLAVSWTDFYQGILMFFALLIVPIMLFGKLDGDVADLFSGEFFAQTFCSYNEGNSWGEIVSGLSWGLGYFGMPHILVRFMAIRSGNEIRKSTLIASVWVILTLFSAVCIGLLGHQYLSGEGFAYTNQAAAEKLFMKLSIMLFNPWVSGILLSAILAAIMSSVSSQLLVVGSAMVNDLYGLLCKNNKKKQHLTLISRLSILLVAGVSIWIAWNPNSTVMGFVSYAWSGFAATFAPVILFSLIWRRVTVGGVVSGLIVGAVTVIVWESAQIRSLTGLSSTLPGFLLASVSIIGVSLLGKKTNPEILKKFDRAEKM